MLLRLLLRRLRRLRRLRLGLFALLGQAKVPLGPQLRDREDWIGAHAVPEVDRLVKHPALEEEQHQDAASHKGGSHHGQRPLHAVGDAEVDRARGAREALFLLVAKVALRAAIAEGAGVPFEAPRINAAQAYALDRALPYARPVARVLVHPARCPKSGLRAVDHTTRAQHALGHAVGELPLVKETALAALSEAHARVPAGEAEGALGLPLLIGRRARLTGQALGLSARRVATGQAVGAPPCLLF